MKKRRKEEAHPSFHARTASHEATQRLLAERIA
jgi:hypothetical protein